MNPEPPEDDPTHALDDFIRRMRPAAAPPPADDPTSLAGLQARLHPERASDAGRPRGGRLRSGQTWDADDVVDVASINLPPVPPDHHDQPEVSWPAVDLAAESSAAARPLPELALPAVSAPPPVDSAALEATLQQASARASAQYSAEDLAAEAPAWQPDLRSLQLRRDRHPRLLERWQTGAWTAAMREVMAPATEFVTTAAGTVVDSYPPQRLLLLWPPQRLDAPLLGRWPQQVQLCALPADEAAETLLAGLPGDALLWLHPGGQDIDWALAAEIVLTHQPALRPFHAAGLRSFIDAERDAGFARLNSLYQQAPGGARLR